MSLCKSPCGEKLAERDWLLEHRAVGRVLTVEALGAARAGKGFGLCPNDREGEDGEHGSEHLTEANSRNPPLPYSMGTITLLLQVGKQIRRCDSLAPSHPASEHPTHAGRL